MAYTANQDPLCYPETGVLINIPGIRDQTILDEIEVSLFLTRFEEPWPEGKLDFAYYRLLHQHFFQDLYRWAGDLRTIRIGKSGIWFAYPEHIASAAERLFSELAAANHLQNLGKLAFAQSAAHFLAELNAIRPFRDGNGRTQMAYMSLLASRCGYGFRSELLDPERVISAMIRSFHGDETALASLIGDLIS